MISIGSSPVSFKLFRNKVSISRLSVDYVTELCLTVEGEKRTSYEVPESIAADIDLPGPWAGNSFATLDLTSLPGQIYLAYLCRPLIVTIGQILNSIWHVICGISYYVYLLTNVENYLSIYGLSHNGSSARLAGWT